MALRTEADLKVSASDPRHWGRCLRGFLRPSPSEENADNGRKEEGEQAEDSESTCRCQRVVRFLLTFTSSGERLQ